MPNYSRGLHIHHQKCRVFCHDTVTPKKKTLAQLDWGREDFFSVSSNFESASVVYCCMNASPPTDTPRKTEPAERETRGDCCKLPGSACFGACRVNHSR